MQCKLKNSNLLGLMMVVLMIGFVFSCGGKKSVETVADTSTETTGAYDDFFTFYERFHADPEFQMERITFPLEGLPGMADSLLVNHGEFFYNKEGWTILNPIEWDTVTMFERRLEDTGLGVINEYICTFDKFCISRRFAKLGDGWFLIYYADMNYRPDL